MLNHLYYRLMTSQYITRRYRQYTVGLAPRRWAFAFEMLYRITLRRREEEARKADLAARNWMRF